jgi:diguanylate cyclase (GGDEF)-like protein
MQQAYNPKLGSKTGRMHSWDSLSSGRAILAGLHRASHYRRSRAVLRAPLLSLLLAWGTAFAAAPAQAPATAAGVVPPLYKQLAEIQEIVRINPQRALPMLDKLAAELPTATPGEHANFLSLSCIAQYRLGHNERALPLCEQALALGRRHNDEDAIARALLAKAYALFAMNEMAQSHQLVWEAEKLALDSQDRELRLRAMVSSGESYAEDGNFPSALNRIQAAVTQARQSGDPLSIVITLNSLAYLYNQMREHGKAFDALDEAYRAAKTLDSPARLATLKNTEYGAAMDSGQLQRGLKLMREELDLVRQIGADPMIATALVNLSDCLLKLRNHHAALTYAQQALEQGRKLKDERVMSTARLNIGQAYLAMGRLAEGKKSIEEGMAWYEKSGHKPDLQMMLTEYGDALERAGDFAGAVGAYHRERALSNELFEKRRQKAMLELQEKYEADKRQRQIELLRQENQVKSTEIDNRRLQQRVWWLLATVFGLASAIVLMLYRKVRQANAQLEEKNQELKQQSARDPLTGLYNRRHFQEYMRGHMDTERRISGNVSGLKPQGDDMVSALFLLDVDHFKHINDTYGHGAGDAVLREIATGLREILRETDMIVRWGGEEFLAFLPAVPRGGLDEVALRLLSGIPARTIDYQGTRLSVNVSIGFAPFPLVRGAALSWERAVNIVDMALYLAKGHGRNRAYGVRGIKPLDAAALLAVEQDIERARRAGLVDLSVVQGGMPVLRAMS